nr:aryl-sulfate sulfotransferase [Candidatus Neomarinimicrobiota bacterium]
WRSSIFAIGQNSATFTNDNIPITVINHRPELTSNGVVVFGSFISKYSAAIDIDGNEVWNSGKDNSFVYFHYDEEGELLGGVVDNTYPYAYNIFASAIDKDLNTLFIESLVNQNQYTHYYIPHEIIKLPNGNYVSLAPDFRNLPVSRKEDIYTGNWSWETGNQFTEEELASFPWMGDFLIEWNPETNEIIWSMSTFDIYDINDYDIFGGNWNAAASGLFPVYDWTHLNAIEYNAEQNAIYISSRHLSKITKIDYETRQVMWTMGWSQIEIYGIENSFSNFSTTYFDGTEAPFSFQHGLQVLDNGNIVTLDNGNLSKLTWIPIGESEVNKSRVIEIEVEENINTAKIVWEYILPDSLYSELSGNAQKLYNGNYFVTVIADGATSLEISPTKEVVWECKYNLETGDAPIYRAHKISEIPMICPTTIDQCGVCGGDNSLCLGCDDVPNSQSGYDCAGECGGIEDECSLNNDINIVHDISLLEAYPNPFNPILNIKFVNHSLNKIDINIYNIRGRHVERLVYSELMIGENILSWDGENYPSGIYFIKLASQDQIFTQKVVLLK